MNGPGKVCQALAIDQDFNGHDLTKQPLTLTLHSRLPSSQIAFGTRIGITKAADVQWRFFVKDRSRPLRFRDVVDLAAGMSRL